jgi:hypothetical protein
MEYKKVRGTQNTKPLELEVNVDTVYLRKNIERKSETDELGQIHEFWEYDEMQLTLREFALMQAGGVK